MIGVFSFQIVLDLPNGREETVGIGYIYVEGKSEDPEHDDEEVLEYFGNMIDGCGPDGKLEKAIEAKVRAKEKEIEEKCGISLNGSLGYSFPLTQIFKDEEDYPHKENPTIDYTYIYTPDK